MKETKEIEKDQVVIEKQAEVEKKLQYLGSHKMRNGQKMWEFNKATGEIKIAEMEELPVNPYKKTKNNLPEGPRKKIITNENCVYVPAINIENAVRKLGLKVKIVKGKK
jgi:hypothetical protein